MKILSLVLATFLFLLTRTFAADHLLVQGCDLFISKVMASSGPFNSGYVNLYLKADHELKEQIQEVGFKYEEISTGKEVNYRQVTKGELKAVQTGDYYLISIPVTYQYGDITYNGHFYLKTNSANYQLKTYQGLDFLIDRFTYFWLTETAGFRSLSTASQHGDYFNPPRCH